MVTNYSSCFIQLKGSMTSGSLTTSFLTPSSVRTITATSNLQISSYTAGSQASWNAVEDIRLDDSNSAYASGNAGGTNNVVVVT